MRLAIMQPYFLPYIGYFQAISSVDKYILYDNLAFIKEAWMNRNRIMQKNGQVLMVTVPLKHKSSFTLIRDIMIDNDKPWKKSLLKTIELNYRGAQFYDEVYALLEEIISPEIQFLSELNSRSIKLVCSYLGINTIIESDNTGYLDLEDKLNLYEQDKSIFSQYDTMPEKKVLRVFEMCRRNDADFFVNAIGGQDLYSKDEFARYGIDLHFVKTENVQYSQFNKPFQENLSILDVLMHNGKEGTKELLSHYSLI